MSPVPEVQNILDALAQLPSVPLADMSLEAARGQFKQMEMLLGVPPDVGSVTSLTVPGPAGPIAARLYQPAGHSPESPPAPGLVWFHGGGFVIGDLDTAEFSCRAVTARTGAAVVSVDYRLAPEHRFPAAAEDSYAATCWVAEHAAELGIDVDALGVAGDSAGGNLAAVVALMARDRGGPALVFQGLIYPVTDAAMDTPSYKENASGYLLSAVDMAWFWDCYLGPDGDASNPLASPLRSPDLANLPPAFIVTAEFDPLRDEGEAYGQAMAAAGVKVRTERYDGQIHGFFALPVFGAQATQAVADFADMMAQAVNR